jgi:predicted nucleic acid-binding protein
MSKIKVICNTSPIIGLMSINRLYLLWQLFDEIIIPQAVERELCADSTTHPQEVQQVKQCIADNKFTVYQVQDEELVKKLYGKLHYGELEVIVGAKECNLTLAIIDERAARKLASNFLIDTIGILGILSLAKKQGLIERVKPDVDLLRSRGYRISEVLYEKILTSNGERDRS